MELIEPGSHWKELQAFEFPPESGNVAARRWAHSLVDLHVLRSKSVFKNNEEWIHLSVSRPDISKIKNEFLGEEREAVHIIPAKKDYVNLHRYCMHIWAPWTIYNELPNLQKIKWEHGL